MLTIRLTRKGKKNQPFFRVVVIDKKRSSKGGRAVEDLGYKNPLTKKVSINKERVLYWIKTGAQPSASVHNLLVSEKILDEKKIHVSRMSKKAREAAKTAVIEAAKTAAAEATKAATQAAATPAPVVEKPAEAPAPVAETPKPAEEAPKA
jgi:small subunit ribosomal protein S16